MAINSKDEQTVEYTVKLPVIWDVMTSMWRHYDGCICYQLDPRRLCVSSVFLTCIISISGPEMEIMHVRNTEDTQSTWQIKKSEMSSETDGPQQWLCTEKKVLWGANEQIYYIVCINYSSSAEMVLLYFRWANGTIRVEYWNIDHWLHQ